MIKDTLTFSGKLINLDNLFKIVKTEGNIDVLYANSGAWTAHLQEA